jgi:peptide-methionine (R)-S-oxide reductase
MAPVEAEEMKKVPKTNQEFKECLTPEQYHILREKSTELPFTGKYYLEKRKGMYVCAACGNSLFSSDTKFESGTGWPSFYDAISRDKIKLKEDSTLGVKRTEVLCGRCGSHLGHMFEDGPKPTGLRYCINSAALDLQIDTKENKSKKKSV